MPKSLFIGKYFKLGNTKLSRNTLIFNMGSSLNCPSRILNLCPYKDICYARKAEIQYERVLPYRERQTDYWLNNKSYDIYLDIEKIIKKRTYIKYFRFNESGDFHSQDCIKKLNEISYNLKNNFNVTTYGYTQRHDLDFSKIEFIIKGSGFQLQNGKTIVINKDEKPKGFKICPSKGCGEKCTMCMQDKKINIAFRKH